MPRSTQNLVPTTAATTERDLKRPLFFSALGFCLILALFLSSPAEAGKVFRWTTSDGTVHYGEHPPQGVEATQMSTTTGKPSKQSSRRERVEPGEDTGKEAPPTQEGESTATAPAAVKPKKDKGVCERARYNLKVLDERARIRQTDENGEERYLSDEEKNKQKEKAREAIKTFC
ncbi:MAG: DUF4124 domain-containing protein [Pseudomonadota bacterium]